MTKKIVFGAALALLIVGLAAPSALATCGGSKSAGTYNSQTGLYPFWHTTLTLVDTDGVNLVAKVWQPGGNDVTGTCNTRNSPDGNAGILYFANPGQIGMNVDFSDACVGGGTLCPGGTLAVLATVTRGNKTEFLATQTPETPAGGLTFDFSSYGDHEMFALPRPRVTGSSRAGSLININVALDAVNAALYEGTGPLFTGYNILSKLNPTDPGRLASAYDVVPLATAAASGGGPATSAPAVDCTGNLNSRWVVTQLVTANGPSPTVSEATRVSCDPSLADPKYKIVPKKKSLVNSKSKN